MSDPSAPTDPVPLIPREVLFGNPTRASPELSADGEHLAYLAPDDNDVLQVWLARDDGDDECLTADPKRGIRMFTWSYRPGYLLYFQDSDGDENFHLFGVDLDSRNVRDLTAFEGVRCQNLHMSPHRPEEVLAEINLRDRAVFDLHRVDLRTGAVETVAENPGNILVWTCDENLHLRAATAAGPEGGFQVLLRKDDRWDVYLDVGPDETAQANFTSADGKTLYVETDHNANATRLLAVDLDTQESSVVAEDPDGTYDLSAVIRHPTTRQIQAVGFYREKLHWTFFDDALADDFQHLQTVRDGEVDIVSRTLDDRQWLVKFAPVSHCAPIHFQASDGLTIHGYLTLPVNVQPTNLPAVLLVHGGPWVRDTWGYHPTAQWLANRGYAVLQVNYRGSTGYGKAFMNAGNRQWAARMHDDLVDAVNWLAERGTADADRVAIMGGSYGGYATLVGLTFTPELFACGVDIVGPSSLLTLIDSIPPYWKPLMRMFHHRVGDPETDADMLRDRSPLHKADRICKPLQIFQGANDPRVKQSESDQIVQAMRDKGLPVEYVVYTDEGHGFARPANRLHQTARTEQFLAQHLGGRAQPVGEIQGHSGQDR